MRHPRTLLFGITLTLLMVAAAPVDVFAQATATAGATGVSAAARIPAGAMLYITCPDGETFRDRFSKSNFSKMLNDESLSDVRSQIEAKIDEAMQEIESELGLKKEELWELGKGEVSFALLKPEDAEYGGILFLGIEDARDQLDTLLEKAATELENEGGDRSTDTVDGIEIITFTHQDGDEDRNVSYFIHENMFVGSNSLATLEYAIEGWDGSARNSFHSDPGFSVIREKCQGDHDDFPMLTWYIDLIGLVELGIKNADSLPVPPQQVLGFIPLLGFDRLKAMGGAFDMGGDDFDAVSQAYVFIEQPVSGVLKAFVCPAVEQSPPNWVSADATGYSSTNWDAANAYTAAEQVTDFFMGAGSLAALMDQVASSPNGPQIHPRRDVIDHLTGRIQTVADAGARDSASGRMVVALEVKDMNAIRKVVDKLTGLAPNMEERDFRGVTIHEMDLSQLAQGNPSVPPSVGICVARDQLLIGLDVTLLEQVLRSETVPNPLADSDDYKAVAKWFPAKTSIMTFQRTASQVEQIYGLLKSGQLDTGDSGIDFTQLPEFDVLRKYLRPAGSYAVPDENGVMMIEFSIK